MYSCKLSSWFGACESAGQLQSRLGNMPRISSSESSRMMCVFARKQRPQAGEGVSCAGIGWSSEDIMNCRSNASLRMRVS
jgi:hypothetical protein